MTSKHKNTDKILTNTDAENAENASVTNEFNCECGNTYKHRQSLFNHKKKCDVSSIADSNVDSLDKNQLILMLINKIFNNSNKRIKFQYKIFLIVCKNIKN